MFKVPGGERRFSSEADVLRPAGGGSAVDLFKETELEQANLEYE